MTYEEIVKLVRFISGTITTTADSYYDEIAKNNLNKRYEVISHLISDIGFVAETSYCSPFASEQECGEIAIQILKNLKSEIEEFLQEIDENLE